MVRLSDQKNSWTFLWGNMLRRETVLRIDQVMVREVFQQCLLIEAAAEAGNYRFQRTVHMQRIRLL